MSKGRRKTMKKVIVYLDDKTYAMLEQVINYRRKMFGVKVSKSELIRELVREGLVRKIEGYKMMLGKACSI